MIHYLIDLVLCGLLLYLYWSYSRLWTITTALLLYIQQKDDVDGFDMTKEIQDYVIKDHFRGE